MDRVDSPEKMVADNDYAVGLLVQRSPIARTRTTL